MLPGARAVSRNPLADHFQLRLVDSRMLASTVRHLALERTDGQPKMRREIKSHGTRQLIRFTD